MTNINIIPSIQTLLAHGISYGSTAFASFVSPVKNISAHFFPFIETVYSYNHIDLTSCKHKFLDLNSKNKLTKTINEIKTLAGLKRNISVFTKMNIAYSSRGGELSITSPIVYMPYEQMINEEKQSELKYTTEEKEFLIAKQILRIKNNYEIPLSMYRIAMGVMFCFYLIYK